MGLVLARALPGRALVHDVLDGGVKRTGVGADCHFYPRWVFAKLFGFIDSEILDFERVYFIKTVKSDWAVAVHRFFDPFAFAHDAYTICAGYDVGGGICAGVFMSVFPR